MAHPLLVRHTDVLLYIPNLIGTLVTALNKHAASKPDTARLVSIRTCAA